MPEPFFTEVPTRIGYGGPGAGDALSYTVYEPNGLVLGKRMEDHLRIAVSGGQERLEELVSRTIWEVDR